MASITKKTKILTEDLGKIFEKSICLLYDTPYDGTFKYDVERAEILKNRISALKNVFPTCIHTAKNGSRYDFTTNSGDIEKHLSAKTTKKDGKVCPQVIGQCTKKKFCEHFTLPTTSTCDDIKSYIQQNLNMLLKQYFVYTFDCDTIYYNEKKNLLKYVTKKNEIEWEQYPLILGHIDKNKAWNESTTLYLQQNAKNITLGEFQIHTHRDGIKFRWNFEKLLDVFPDNFIVVDL